MYIFIANSCIHCLNTVPPRVIPVNDRVVGVEGMSAVLSFTVMDAFPLVTNNNVRWEIIREGVATDITNLTIISNNTLEFQYNMAAQIYSLNISNIQPGYSSEFKLTVTNPAGVDDAVIDLIVEG